jgi:outer membrane protein
MKTLCFALLASASLHAAELTIQLQNPPASGPLRILLFDSPETFGDLRDPAFSQTVPARAEVVVTNVPPGDYALMVHHDENSNGELDKNFIGIPREPTGFANGYSPKGPPTYRRAVLTLDSRQTVAVELRRALGERGQIGAGVGVLFKSSPYVGSDEATVLPIPAITYTGDRLQIFGPYARFMLTGSDRARLALAANYRTAAYEEDDSPALEGLGDRDGTLLAGPELKIELPQGFGASIGYRHDVLDRIGGGEASATLDRSFSAGSVRLTPEAGARWVAGQLNRHDYGTSSYHPGSTVSLTAGLSATVELTDCWWVVGSLGVERLADDVTDSPIVEDDLLVSGFFAVNYLF